MTKERVAAFTPPILRWAGGKRWLIAQLRELLGNLEINQYHEPFLGGGSVFFGYARADKSYLSDLNTDLIETYQQVRDDVKSVVTALETHSNTEQHYYRVRENVPSEPSARAARFIFLNHTSFNGIYRVNLKGTYNVPYGRRKVTNIPTRQQLIAVSQKLQGVHLAASDFGECVFNISEGDLVFLDPPYTVAHNNNGFIKYNQRLFSFEDQHRLSSLIDEIRRKDAYYVLTNAAHESIAELFSKGDRCITMSRRNSIGGKDAVRGTATEYLFTNVEKRS